jgi:cytochrome c biogenesis protein CcmG/thiol:disulfide interchange protein DsbE
MVPLDELEPQRPRRRSWRLLVALVPAAAFVALLAFGLARSGSRATLVNEAPDFELPLLSRQDETLSSNDLQGHPVVVNFWASWCIPCREEAPLLERTWRRYKDDGVIFLGVNIKDAESDAEDFIQEFGLTYPNVRDLEQELTRPFGVTGLPETFFIDHNWTFFGTVRGNEVGQDQGTVVLGAISEEELITNVELLVRRAASE